ncbi:hypothetical protein [Ruminococcus flavefaciens]|uniref:hypothetical protein n=1 Tax=Ruminococcus flavefaciens TaxID=1265 RepID=UPI0015663628|nr:hypothetical protein [Ruminococcus flavefaciens]
MNIFRAQNVSGLAEIRMKYLREDFPFMTDAEAARINAKLRGTMLTISTATFSHILLRTRER